MENRISKVSLKVELLDGETGIAFLHNTGDKEEYTISYDSLPKIENVDTIKIFKTDQISDELVYDRLIRDIQSKDVQTRIYSSEILCNFIEFPVSEMDFKILKDGFDKMIIQLKRETNPDVEQKLAEGILEFIIYENLSIHEQKILLEKATRIDSYHIWSYLNDEDFLKIPKVYEYIEKNRTKWKSREDEIYGDRNKK